MSLTKSTLLASASLIAAGLAAIAFAPAAAVAQTATCTATTAVTGNGTGAVTIAGGANEPGITCAYAGAGATVSTAGAVSVSSNAGGNGVNLSASGTTAINWNSQAGNVTGGAQTNGAVIEALGTGAGAINVSTLGVTGFNATITHGVRAVSSGGGAVTVSARGDVSATSSTGAGAVPGGSAGIEAVSTGGAGDVTVSTGLLAGASARNFVSGRLRGIYAQASGAGALTINVGGGVDSTSGTGLEAVTGTGLLTINVLGQANPGGPTQDGQQSRVGSSTGTGMLLRPGGDAVINLGLASLVEGAWGIDAVTLAGRTTTVNISNEPTNNNETWDATLRNVKAAGAGAFIINNNGAMRGAGDFQGMINGAEINILSRGVWLARAADIRFGAGGDVLTTMGPDGAAPGGVVFTGLTVINTGGVEGLQVIDFGGGDDLFDNGGYLIINPALETQCGGGVDAGCPLRTTNYEGGLRIDGLETFRNAGVVSLGGWDDGARDSRSISGNRDDDVQRTDGWYDDVLSLPGATFVGDGGEIRIDVDILRSQSNCTTRNADGDLGAADCLILTGGATEGVINLNLVEIFPGDRGGANLDGIVLVDVAGGTSAQGHVVVGPNSVNYRNVFGGVLDKGAFFFPVIYNEATQQHMLFGLPSDNALQQLLVAEAGHSLWRLSTGTWLDRQADLRGDVEDGVGGGVWMRVSGESAERDVLQPIGAAGQVFEWDNSHTTQSYAVMGGFDVLSGSGGDSAYVVGMMAGYVHSDIEYEQSSNQQRFNGASLGGYASLVSGGLYVDAVINAHRLTVREDIPTLNLFPAGTLVSTRAVSLGGQVEAGWRFPVMEGAFVEPLAGLSYVRTTYDDMVFVPDDATRTASFLVFDDPTSLRAGLGARLGLDQDYGGFRAQYSALGRVWNEFEDEVAISLLSAGPEMDLTDDISGQFTEVGLGASLYSPGGAVSGFVNLGGRFGDDYQAQTGSVGVRVNW